MSTPRIIALINWYDESQLWLSATIASIAQHVDHVIAIDGAYALYPGGVAQSRSDQACVIVETCQAAGLGLTLHRPQHVWLGNEVEKRNRMFRLADLEAQPNRDWLLVLDADTIIDKAPHDLRQQLGATDLDVAQAMVWERGDPQQNPARAEHERTVALPADSLFPVRVLFRAIPGLHCHGAHYVYRTPDGRYLWGDTTHAQEPALDLRDLMRIEHRTHYRPLQRHQNQHAYYRRRNQAGVETSPVAAQEAREEAQAS